MTSTEPRTDIFEDRPDEPMSDALLLQAARDGSTGAFGVLYARHREHAVAVARRTLGALDANLAEDVAESAFIDVFSALRNGGGPTDTLRFYLTTAVRREAWRTQGRQRRQAETADRWTTELAVASSAAVDAGDALGAHVLLTEAFRGLSERWRHVLWLTEVEGRRPAEIAPMLGVSAGTASALAYRARQGLIAAYVGAYRARRDDPACAAIGPRLAEFVAAGPDALGFDDVRAHLDGCASCRDLARGVDVGAVLGAVAPFGLLTAGWWAKAVVVGSSKAMVAAGAGALGAGATGAAVASGVGTGAGAGAGAGGAGIGGAGIAGVVAAAIAAAVVIAGAVAGLTGRGGDEPAAGRDAAAVVEGASVDGAATPTAATVAPSAPVGEAPPTTAGQPPTPIDDGTTPTATRPLPGTATTTTVARPPATTISSVATTVPRATTTVPRATTTVPRATTTVPRATTTTVPSTTVAPSSTTVPSSTTTTRPDDPGHGVLSGGILRTDPVSGAEVPVGGVRVVATNLLESVEATSGPDGRWRFPALEPGYYLVIAHVPSQYRPRDGLDPWVGGDTWPAVLGLVEVGTGGIDLVDLHLVDR